MAEKLPHIIQTQKQLADRYGLKIYTLQRWRIRKRIDHRYPRFYKPAGGKSVFYFLDEFDEDLKNLLEQMTVSE